MSLFDKYTFNIIMNETSMIIKDQNLREQIEVFDKVLEMPIENERIKAVGKSLSKSITNFYHCLNDHIECLNSFRGFGSYEMYMKKLYYIVDQEDCEKLLDEGKTLCHYLIKLNVFSNGLAKKLRGIEPEDYRKASNYLYHSIISYISRNDIAHENQFYNFLEMLQLSQSLLVSMISTTWRYQKEVNDCYNITMLAEKFDFKEYCSTIIQNYESKEKQGFTYIHVKWTEKNYNQKTRNLDDVLCEEVQKGTILVLKDLCSKTKRIMLIGEAGTGKSTSLEYLEYVDAKAFLEGKSKSIPLLIRLYNFEKKVMLEDHIAELLHINKNDCIYMLKSGLINVYLDGINEMITSIRVKSDMIELIQNALDSYKDTFFVITDRYQTDKTVSRTVPTFTLQPMLLEEITEFIQRNSNDPKVMEEALRILIQNERIRTLVNTPFKIKQWLEILTVNKDKIPDNTIEFTQAYLDALILREYNEKKDPNADPYKLKLLLMALSLKKIPEDGLTKAEVFQCFKNCMTKFGFIIDTILCTMLAAQLGILKNSNDKYYFAYPEYQYCLETEAAMLDVDWE